MNRFYERFTDSFCHVLKSSSWQPKLQLQLKPKLHPHIHLKVLLPLKPRLKPTPLGIPPPLTPHPQPPATPPATSGRTRRPTRGRGGGRRRRRRRRRGRRRRRRAPFENRSFECGACGGANLATFSSVLRVSWCHRVCFSCYLRQNGYTINVYNFKVLTNRLFPHIRCCWVRPCENSR